MPSIPPKEQVMSKVYEYSPLDLPLPPMSSNSFLHYLENPYCESLLKTTRWSACLPKRLEEQLESRRRSSEPNIVITGWGIHIDEGLNEEALACITFVTLVISGIVSIVYSVKTGDTSSGFALGAYLASVIGVFVAMMYYRWQND